MMLRQIVGMSMLAFLSLACCQTDFRSIFTEASKHLVGILGRQYQNEAVSAAICFQRPDVLEVSGDRIECQDQPEEVEFLSFGQPQLTGVTFLNQSISESEVQGFHPEQRADYPCWLSLHESYPKPCSLPTGYTNKLETTVFLEETFLAVKPVILQVDFLQPPLKGVLNYSLPISIETSDREAKQMTLNKSDSLQAEALVLPGECIKFSMVETVNTTLVSVNYTVPITGGVSVYFQKISNKTIDSDQNHGQEMWYHTPGFSLFKYAREGGFAGGLESQDEKTFYYRGSFQIQQRVLTYAFDETVESFCTCQKAGGTLAAADEECNVILEQQILAGEGEEAKFQIQAARELHPLPETALSPLAQPELADVPHSSLAATSEARTTTPPSGASKQEDDIWSRLVSWLPHMTEY